MNLYTISKNRNELMGLSIISIMLFHFTEDCVVLGGAENPLILLYYYLIRSVGVDIFLFLSGMGLYYSFTKNSNLAAFYNKRFSKILMVYIPVGLVFWALRDLWFCQKTIGAFFSDFLLITVWTEGNYILWYIALILVLYLAFPLLYRLYFPNGGGTPDSKASWGSIAAVIGLNVLLCLLALEKYREIEIATTRIPIFCVGVFGGYFVKNRKELPVRRLVPFLVVGSCLQLLNLPTSLGFPYLLQLLTKRYVFGWWGLVLVLLACCALDGGEHSGLRRVLQTAGNYSLELYLTHVTLRNLAKCAKIQTCLPQNYLPLILCAVLISVALRWAENRLNALRPGQTRRG